MNKNLMNGFREVVNHYRRWRDEVVAAFKTYAQDYAVSMDRLEAKERAQRDFVTKGHKDHKLISVQQRRKDLFNRHVSKYKKGIKGKRAGAKRE